MVFNNVRMSKLPFSSNTVSTVGNRIMGSGNGSVLLRKGGSGSASSYMDLDDYIKTTGIDPYKRNTTSGTGMSVPKGFKKLTDKISKLSISDVGKSKPKKNIVMSM